MRFKSHPQTVISEVPTDESEPGKSVGSVAQAVTLQRKKAAAETDTLKATVPARRNAVMLEPITYWLAGNRLRPTNHVTGYLSMKQERKNTHTHTQKKKHP